MKRKIDISPAFANIMLEVVKFMNEKSEPKYKIGQKIKVGHWSGETDPLEILDIRWIYHPRMYEHCWGYKMDGYTHLTFTYVPEGYLRPD